MSENVRRGPSKTVIILSIVIAVLVLGGAAAAAMILLNGNNAGDSEDGEPVRTIGYENEGIIILNEDDLNKLDIHPAEGMVDLTYKYIAESVDGVNFACEIYNSTSNLYDMYFNIYLDESFEQQILLTGLIPPGGGIDRFVSEIPLEKGTYETVLTMTQVGEDHASIVGQVNVVLTLVVHDPDETPEIP